MVLKTSLDDFLKTRKYVSKNILFKAKKHLKGSVLRCNTRSYTKNKLA